MSKSIVEIKGFPELQRKITQLADPKDKRRELLNILRSVAKTTVIAARNYAPVSKKSHVARGKVVSSGSLKRSIGTITSKSKENPTIYVGPRAKGKNVGWYGNFVEAGHNVYRNKSVRVGGKKTSVLKRVRKSNKIGVVGSVKGDFFMKRAYILTKGAVTKEAEQRTAKFIQRRIDKLSN